MSKTENKNQDLQMKMSSLKEINEAVQHIKDLEAGKDKNHALSEKLNNLGVKNALSAIGKSEIATHPAFSYMFEKLMASTSNPEWMIVENVINALKPFNWFPLVNECLQDLKENADKNKEEIAIYKIMEGFKAPSSSYLFTAISESLESYLHSRSSSDRIRLIESTSKYLFDPNMKALYNFLMEAESAFNVNSIDDTCTANPVYSPVLTTEACEFFVAAGKVYKKFEDTVTVANESEIQALPDGFKTVAQILGWSNVSISEGKVKIYSGDKIVEITEGQNQPIVKINNKEVSLDEIHTVYLNAGIFRMNERDNISAIYALVENWNSIFEIDFAKVIDSKADTNRQVTLFFLGENIFINKVNRAMNEDFFYSNCTAIQANNLLIEFMKFDASNTFAQLMNEEQKQLQEVSALKAEYLQAIDHLNGQKNLLENTSADIRNTSEVKELIEAIDEEIDLLKKEFSRLANAERSATQVSEGMGFNVGDEAEHGKKK